MTPAKHAFDILHIAHGLGPDNLVDVLAATDVGINLHNEAYPNFENRATLHLAAGHLLISEALQPMYGLDRGLDYLEIGSAHDLVRLLHELRRAPDIFRRVRIRVARRRRCFAHRRYTTTFSTICGEISVVGTVLLDLGTPFRLRL